MYILVVLPYDTFEDLLLTYHEYYSLKVKLKKNIVLIVFVSPFVRMEYGTNNSRTYGACRIRMCSIIFSKKSSMVTVKNPI